MEEAQRGVGFALNTLTQLAQAVTSKNDSLAIRVNHLGKFDGNADEGFFVGYSTNSKAFRVFNSRTRIVEENLHVKFSEDTPNIAGSGPNWLFDIDALTNSMNYKPVVAGNQSNGNAGTKAYDDAGKTRMETVPGKYYILLPLWTQDPPFSSSSKDSLDTEFNPLGEEEKKDAKDLKDANVNSTNNINTANDGNNTNNVNAASSTINVAGIKDYVVLKNIVYGCDDDSNMPNLEEIVYSDDDEGVGAEADMTNLNTFMPVSPIPTTRLHKDHPLEQIIGDIHSAPQTSRMTKNVTKHGEPKKVIQALLDPSWIEVMKDELLQNKKDERGIMVRKKARLVAHGYTQEEGIDYDEVLLQLLGLKQLGLFLAYALFMNFVVYQMDVKSAFLYGKIEEEVYVCQPPGFEDPEFPDKVYKVEKALYGLHQAPRAWYETLSTYLLDNGFQRGQIDKTLFIKRFKGDILLVQVYVDDIIFGSTKKELCAEFEKLMHKRFQMSSMGELTFFLGLQVMQKEDGIFISQDKYVDEILKKFGFSTVSDSKYTYRDFKAFDEGCKMLNDVKFQITPKVSYLHAVKRIFRYIKGQSKLGLWYPKDSLFVLEAYTDNDYAGASLDRKSTTGGCQFLGSGLISWQWKKQTIVATSTTEADAVRQKVNAAGLRTVTPLFATMLIQSQAVEGKGSGQPTEPQHTPTTASPSHLESLPNSSGPTTLVADETVHEEREDSMERAATTTASLDAEQDSGNILRTQSMTIPNEPFPQEIGSGDSPRCQETMGDKPAQTRVFDLENVKNAQDLEIQKLKKRVKKLESKKKSRIPQLKRRLFKVRIESSAEKSLGDPEDASKQGRNEIDQDEGIS
ncbi:putative ribonuclease H-like domain-containing protein [Tanacetum coccineum]